MTKYQASGTFFFYKNVNKVKKKKKKFNGNIKENYPLSFQNKNFGDSKKYS